MENFEKVKQAVKGLVIQALGGNYYNKFTWTHDKTETDADRELNTKAETDQDRVLDLLLIMDCTASMSPWIELSKRTLIECIDSVQEEHKELDVRVAFVGYRDFCDTANIFAIKDFTLALQSMKDFISGQTATGGGDLPEDVQGALQQSLDLKWRGNSIKLAYFCADAPAHGKGYHAGVNDDYPNGNPAGLVLENLMQQLSEMEVDFTAYSLTNQTDKMFEVMEQAYNQGKNAKGFKKLDLKKDVDEARKAGVPLAAEGGAVATSHYVSTVTDMKDRTAASYLRKGW